MMTFGTNSLLNVVITLLSCLRVNASNEKNEHALKGKTLSPPARRSSENSSNTSCDLCVMFGGNILDVYPEYDDISPYEALVPPQGMNCAEIAELYSNNITDGSSGECFLSVTYFHEKCCWFPVPIATCEQKVQQIIIGEDSNYNANVGPILSINETSAKVGVSFEYHALTDIDTMEGTVEVIMSITMTWKDERLAWDPKDYGGCYSTHYRASNDPEKTEIWVPAFDLLNRASSLQDLPENYAVVHSNGTLMWDRFGKLKAFCSLLGLARFPYDELSCNFDFGPTLSFERVEYVLYKGSVDTRDQDSSAVGGEAKYQEFSFVPEKTNIQPGPFIRINFYFKRASRYYNNMVVIPTILFTILSFGVFLLDQRVGERLGFGVSLLLVVVAQAILTSDMLPVTKEKLWINTLTHGSQYFAIASVMESLFVAHLYYNKVNVEDYPSNSSDASSQNEVTDNPEEQDSFIETPNSHQNRNTNAEKTNATISNQANDSGKHFGAIKFHWTVASIKKLDRMCFVLFPTVYSIFLIVLFASIESWG